MLRFRTAALPPLHSETGDLLLPGRVITFPFSSLARFDGINRLEAVLPSMDKGKGGTTIGGWKGKRERGVKE